LAVKRITKRWLINSLGIILIILILLEIVLAFGIKNYYYNTVEQAINARASTISSLLSRYADDTSANFNAQLRKTVEDFDDKDKMELMAIDANRIITITSSGFQPEQTAMPDYDYAIQQGLDRGVFRGFLNGENVMAVTILPFKNQQEPVALRFVVSLTLVDNQIYLYILFSTLVGVAIIFFVVMSSSYFINSIVIPVGDIGKTARRIAQGDFDVRLQKKNEDEIGELCDVINYMAEELANTEKIKNDFISSVSHELRTPLTAIKGWGETIMYSEDIDRETLKKGMRVIVNESERLSSMVEELLDFSRMQSGRLKVVMGKLDLLAELGDAVIMFAERANREGKKLIYEEPDIMMPVMGDKNRLRQVFVNIIDNALKYSDAGDTVEIIAYSSESEAVILIKDTGCGISEADLPKVKVKFYKANATRRGSGIGLAVADEIIKLHSGTLNITSKEGKGTTVEIRLPLKKKSEDITQISHG